MSVNYYKFLTVLSLVFGYIIIINIIDLSKTDDAASYIRYFVNSRIMIENYGLRAITNDIGYLSFLVIIKNLPIRPDNIVNFLSLTNFILIFSSIIYLIRDERQKLFLASIILLTSPILTLGHVIHLRQGFALAIFLLTLCALNTKIKNLENEESKFMFAAFIAAFFHTSFLFFLPVLGTYKISKIFFRNKYVVLMCVCLMVLLLSWAQNNIAALLGARQVYDDRSMQVLVNGFGFGLMFFCIFALAGLLSNIVGSNPLPIILALVYITLYLTNPIAGRFLLIIYPLVILTLIRSKNFKYYTLYFIGFNLLSFQGTLEQI